MTGPLRSLKGNWSIQDGAAADPLQDIEKIPMRPDAMEPAGGEQALDDTNVLGTDLGPTEKPVLSTDRKACFVTRLSLANCHG